MTYTLSSPAIFTIGFIHLNVGSPPLHEYSLQECIFLQAKFTYLPLPHPHQMLSFSFLLLGGALLLNGSGWSQNKSSCFICKICYTALLPENPSQQVPHLWTESCVWHQGHLAHSATEHKVGDHNAPITILCTSPSLAGISLVTFPSFKGEETCSRGKHLQWKWIFILCCLPAHMSKNCLLKLVPVCSFFVFLLKTVLSRLGARVPEKTILHLTIVRWFFL